MIKRVSLKKRFIWSLAVYTVLIFALWFGYHSLTYEAIGRGAMENAELAAGRLLDQVSAEFAQMRSIAEIIAASAYVQDFLSAATVEEFYGNADTVSEIIRNAAYPITFADSVITINAAGNYYRFTGGLSNDACKRLHDSFKQAEVSYMIKELDGVLFFCHSAPVYTAADRTLYRVGTVILLTNLNRKRAVLDTALAGMHTAVIQDDIILLSSDGELEGKHSSQLDSAYGLVSRNMIAGTGLSVAAAVKNDALFTESALILTAALILLVMLLVTVAALYRYLSSYMVEPMTGIINGVASLGGELGGRLPEMPVAGKPDFQPLVFAINGFIERAERYNAELLTERQKLFDSELLRRDMRIGLLISQIDAHFVVNAIASISALSAKGDSEKAGQMADGLAQILKHKNSGDAMCNLFLELEVIEKYISVMNIRYNGKFKAEYDVSDALAAYSIPGLILQPVAENALVHGLKNKDSGALIHICGYVKQETLFLEVSDNGSGIMPDKLKEISETLEAADAGSSPEPGLSGVSLLNIQRRIRLRFGDCYGVSVDSVLGEGTTVTVKIPAVPDNSS